MIYTELKFVDVLKQIDELVEEVGNIGGEENSIYDDCHDSEIVMWESDNLTDEAVVILDELDIRAGEIMHQLDRIREEMGVSLPEFEMMKDSCIVNRWELYAKFKGAEIVSLYGPMRGDA